MSDMNIEQARHNMIAQQIRPWEVLDNRVLETILHCPREEFVAESQRNLAFVDMELPIGHGQRMMFPKVEARMLQALAVKPGDKVLEVGTGSGYVTMLLATLANQVHSVEINEELAQGAEKRLADHGVNNVQIHVGDASNGWKAQQPYDVIALTGSLPTLPDSFLEELQIGGRLFAVIGEGTIMEARLVTRLNANEWKEERLFETCLAPLSHAISVDRFSF